MMAAQMEYNVHEMCTKYVYNSHDVSSTFATIPDNSALSWAENNVSWQIAVESSGLLWDVFGKGPGTAMNHEL